MKFKYAAALLLVFAALFGLINILLVPPFMNPDEIQHFMFCAEYAYDAENLEKLDQEVLGVLKDYRWFHFIGVGPGWERIKHIKDIFFLHYFVREKHSISKTYFHAIYGKLLALSGIRAPVPAFYFLRFISLLFYMGIFALSIYFYRRYFESYWIFPAAGQLLLFQPASILTSVNYDVLLTLLGIVFFIFAYRFVTREGDDRFNRYDLADLTVLVLIPALAALVKKGGLLFFIYLLLLLPLKYRMSKTFPKRMAVALAAAMVVFVWFNYWFPGRFFSLYTTVFAKIRSIFQISGDGSGLMSSFNTGFFDSVMDSFFFHTGWMGFKIGPGWYLVLKLFVLASIIAIVVGLVRKKVKLEVISGKWYLYALVLFAIQLLFIWLYYGAGPTAQGRYLYPLMIPMMVFIYGGLTIIEKHFRFSRPFLKLGMLAVQAVVLLLALARVINVFYLRIDSPHAGL